MIAVYVDDLTLLAKTVEEMQAVEKILAAQCKMKDIGKLHYCLVISIMQDENRKCVWMHQKQYILTMLDNFGLTKAKTTSTPSDLSVKLTRDNRVSKKVNQVTYLSVVGSLLYAAIATHPDIAHEVGVVSKFNSQPIEAHLTAT